MANDPRQYLLYHCDNENINKIKKQTATKNFFSQLNVSALNDIGASKVSQGLTNLAHLSNSVRLGDPSLPGILKGTQPGDETSGGNWVLSNLGIPASAIQAVQSFNPNVANLGWSQAKDIYGQVKSGNFNLNNAAGYAQNFQNLYKLANGIFTPSKEDKPKKCWATPYAEALAFRFSPKQKFLFIVEFNYNDDFAHALSDIGKYTAFVVKTSTRPYVHFEYEDLNVYNFRTRYPKRTVYDPMSMTFYDDSNNSSMEFFHSYLNLMSPISNAGVVNDEFESSGMGWDKNLWTSASLGVLPGNNGNINVLNSINLYHVYDFGLHVNRYSFYNPKILEINLDDLDMASSDTNSIAIQFAYDAVFVTTDLDASTVGLKDLTDFEGYPMNPNYDTVNSITDNTTKPASDNLPSPALITPDNPWTGQPAPLSGSMDPNFGAFLPGESGSTTAEGAANQARQKVSSSVGSVSVNNPNVAGGIVNFPINTVQNGNYGNLTTNIVATDLTKDGPESLIP